MKIHSRLSLTLVVALVSATAALMTGCLLDSQAKGGHVVENEVLAGTLYAENGEPAAGANIRIYPVNYVPNGSLIKTGTDSTPAFSAKTDSNGKYYLDSLPLGQYNVLGESNGAYSYLDSVSIGPRTAKIPADTLNAPGSVAFYIGMEPNHPKRTAFIQVLGTNRFASADSSGRMVIKDLARGRYTVRISTTLPDYSPYFGTLTVHSGQDETLKDTIRLAYNGIPVVTGLKAAYDTATGRVTLSWDASKYGFLKNYLVYRSKASDLVPPLLPLDKATVPYFVDSTAAAIPAFFQDTAGASQKFEYRVRIRNLSDDPGAVFRSVVVSIAPQSLVKTALVLNVAANPDRIIDIKDSLSILVRWNNPTRDNDSLLWFTGDGKPLSSTRKLLGRNGVDTLSLRAPDRAGPWTIHAAVKDVTGRAWEDSLTLAIQLGAPSADAGHDTTVSIHDRVNLHGKGTDPLGKIVKMEWDIGASGHFTENPSGDTSITAGGLAGMVSHILRVTDDDGNVALDTLVVNVILDPPHADAGPDTSITVSDTMVLKDRSFDTFGTIKKREWDIGNTGLFIESPTGTTIAVAGPVTGTIKNVLRVTDDDGNISLDTMVVTKFNDFPHVELGATDRLEADGGGYRLKASATDLGRIVKWEWDISNHGTWTAGSGPEIGFLPTEPAGTLLTNRVRVTDDDGNTAEAKVIVEVGKWKVVGSPPFGFFTDPDPVGMMVFDGKILITGYTFLNGVRYSKIIQYDPEKRTWSENPIAAPADYSLFLVEAQGLLYAVGRDSKATSTVNYRYDNNLGQWVENNGSPYARGSVVAASIGDQMFLKSRFGHEPLEVFDLNHNRSFFPSASFPKFGSQESGITSWWWDHSTLSAWNGKIFMTTGMYLSEYDPKADSWNILADLPMTGYGQFGADASVALDGKIYLLSGIGDMSAFNISTSTWEKKSKMPYPKSGLGAIVLNGKIYSMSGIGTLQSYDPKDEP